MNRVLKFRAWDKIRREMVNVKRIDLFHKKVGLGWNEYDGVTWRDYTEVELMQFTGLRDKNGREIFEGDILKIYREDIYDNSTEIEKIGKVVFRDGAFFLEPALEEGWFYILSSELEYWDNEGYEYEIVGNVFENPELLETDTC